MGLARMPKQKIKLVSMIKLSLVATVFVAVIAWGSFRDVNKVLIACGITFMIAIVSAWLLSFVKSDDVKPGQPRLK